MKQTSRMLLRVAVPAILVLGIQNSPAQGTTGGLGSERQGLSAGNYYSVTKPGDFTMEVNIWGSVRTPGRYEVSASTDLVQLLSYAGGPTDEANISKVLVTRLVKLEKGDVTKQQFEYDLEDLWKTDNPKMSLYPGDTVYIRHNSLTGLRDVFTLITTIAAVTSAVAIMVIATK